MTRRNIELILLLIASPLGILMFAMLAINEGQALNMQNPRRPGRHLRRLHRGAYRHAHTCPEADPAILPISFALSGIGIAFITRVAPFSDSPNMAINQVVWLFLGVVLMIAVMAFLRNPDRLANYKYTLAIVGVILLLSPMIPGIGQEIYGSRIWLHVGGFSFQPGEIAKIIIVLFLAGYLAQNREMLSVFTWHVGVPLARHPHAPAAAPHVGRGNAHRRVREGPRQRARLLPRVPGHALRCHGKEVLLGHRLGPRCHRRCRRLLRLRPRADACRYLA